MSKSHKTLVVVILILIVAWITYGCYRQAKAPISQNKITIGFFGPLSGDRASFGTGAQAGVKFLFDKLNTNKYQVIYEDTQGDPKNAVSAINKLIDVDHVSVTICAGFSPECLAAAPIAQNKRVPMFVTSSQAGDLAAAGDYTFMGQSTQTSLGFEAAKLAKKLGYQTAATITPNYNNAVMDGTKGFVEAFQTSAGKITGQETIKPGETDFRTYLKKIDAAHPQVIYLSTLSNETALILKQKTDLGMREVFINNSAIEDPATLAAAGAAANDVLIASFNADIPQSFTDEFQRTFGYAAPHWSAEGYEAAGVVLQALTTAKSSNPTDVRDALAAIKEFPGVTQTLRFDDNGNAQRQVFIKKVSDGKIESYKE